MLKPMHTQVLLRHEKQEPRSKILLTPDPELNEQRGTVLAVGPEVTELAVGDAVIYLKYKESGIMNRLGGEQVIIKEEFILAKLEA